MPPPVRGQLRVRRVARAAAFVVLTIVLVLVVAGTYSMLTAEGFPPRVDAPPPGPRSRPALPPWLQYEPPGRV
jgi:hypothetical protein